MEPIRYSKRILAASISLTKYSAHLKISVTKQCLFSLPQQGSQSAQQFLLPIARPNINVQGGSTDAEPEFTESGIIITLSPERGET